MPHPLSRALSDHVVEWRRAPAWPLEWSRVFGRDRPLALEIGFGNGEFLLDWARAHPDRYMTPWETEPKSFATGILDDVTYDWIPLVEAMLGTAGAPVVAAEADFRSAHRLAHAETDVAVCPTGAAGLAGLLAVHHAAPQTVTAGERIAVLFTGHQRAGDPAPN